MYLWPLSIICLSPSLLGAGAGSLYMTGDASPWNISPGLVVRVCARFSSAAGLGVSYASCHPP
ncbi:hypothetical protein PF010_g29148 [Phytophthora fragariae]|uniref:Secreted protein n=1 Tax=Phytophthora fragariae TaxID=53985 RepID=A0A6A3H3I7_9STRA|nr:hypothetical protein PF011_g28879 [Phytophthora fragariae]KAE9063055.1 hypothetical protein PF010_g29148 [Phytophthora fragariae]KAE9167097.1 hypothetical protein PF004_g28940 [Phytophthora fragariae]KAE9276295.1 hypothetical protein PF008_g29129 [Phytophthora fragariae]